ncbi:hypothetical protein N7504_002691 [Penicillium tannophilum]|nr:hypothetical protein N7504_002691 [Penicillium tannophilum]
MLLKHIFLLVAITASNVSAIANSQQTVDGINVLTKKTLATKQAIDNYNGGFTGALLVAKSIYTAHMTSENIRKNLDSSDPFDGEDGDRTMDAYNQFAPVLLDTLRAGQQKAPLFRNSGVAYPAQAMINNLYNEKGRFEDSMHGQLSSNHSLMVKPSVDVIDREFRKTLDAFS